jgi:hypothetical protein
LLYRDAFPPRSDFIFRFRTTSTFSPFCILKKNSDFLVRESDSPKERNLRRRRGGGSSREIAARAVLATTFGIDVSADGKKFLLPVVQEPTTSHIAAPTASLRRTAATWAYCFVYSFRVVSTSNSGVRDVLGNQVSNANEPVVISDVGAALISKLEF